MSNARSPAGGQTPQMPNDEMILVLVEEVASAIRSLRVESPKPDDKISMDYQITVDMIKKLMEIRFQCLTFMMAVTAAAFALLSKDATDATRLVMGLLGSVGTLGIAIYELRNSQIHDAAMHRAKFLEGMLNLPRSTAEKAVIGTIDGGLFGERPPYVQESYGDLTASEFRRRSARAFVGDDKIPFKKFWHFFDVKHDRGLALIYAAVLGSWSYLAIEAMLTMHSLIGDMLARFTPFGIFEMSGSTMRLVALAIALTLSYSFWKEFIHHDEARLKRPSGPMT